jgi:hypothetical protein
MDWHFTTYQLSTGRYVALGKTEPFETGDFFTEPGDVHFAFGDTKEEALDQLKRETLN